MSCQEYFCFADYMSAKSPVTDSFIIYCTNARSIKAVNKFESIKLNVSELNPLMVAVTETWLKKGDSDYFQIKDYNFIELSRKDKRGGGVGLYCHCSIPMQKIAEYQDDYDLLHAEVIICDIVYNVILVYNPHELFAIKTINKLEEIILSLGNKNILILGDFNIKILINNSKSQLFIDMLDSYNIRLNNRKIPTRQLSRALIDHFATNL